MPPLPCSSAGFKPEVRRPNYNVRKNAPSVFCSTGAILLRQLSHSNRSGCLGNNNIICIPLLRTNETFTILHIFFVCLFLAQSVQKNTIRHSFIVHYLKCVVVPAAHLAALQIAFPELTRQIGGRYGDAE